MPINITNDLLIKLAGKPAFMRGQSVFENQQIESWQCRKNTVTALVQGTEPYRVKLTITNKMLDGVCSCPASDHFDFCKHCVAVALAVSAHQQEIDDKAQGSSIDRIEAYLMQQSKQDLQKHLLNFIEQNPQLEKQWLLKADLSHGAVDAKMLRKKITQAIPYRSLWEYRQVGAYFSNAEAAIDLLIEPIANQHADDQLKLIMYAYQRLNKALERIDDSGGYRFGLENTLSGALSDAYTLLDWPPKKKAAFLCDQLEQSYDVFPSIPEDFIGEEDEALMTQFIQQCESRWQKLFSGADENTRKTRRHNRFSHVLLNHANQLGDTQREIEILIATAHSWTDYKRLAEKHIDIKKYDEAEWWLEKAEKADNYGFGMHDRFARARIKIDIGRSNYADALDKQWKHYTNRPSEQRYQDLQFLYKKNGLSETECYQKTEAYLLNLAHKKRHQFGHTSITPLVDFYIAREEYNKAVEIAKNASVDAYQMVELGLLIAKDKPKVAIEFHRRAAIAIARPANKNAYRASVEILVKLKASLHKESLPVLQKMVERLRRTDELKRKPNFVKALNRKFPRT